jgi:hypothetical protein
MERKEKVDKSSGVTKEAMNTGFYKKKWVAGHFDTECSLYAHYFHVGSEYTYLPASQA